MIFAEGPRFHQMRISKYKWIGTLLYGIAAAALIVPAAAQVDLSGEWGQKMHEDAPERGAGPELFFRTDDNRIMVATYSAKADSFVPDKPRLWSDKPLANLGIVGSTNYDLAPDGKRIAALMPVETREAQQSQSHVVFLENFADELQRRVPVAK